MHTKFNTIFRNSFFICGILIFVIYTPYIILDDYRMTQYDHDQLEKCEPKCHVSFLKTHKCASSAIQNALLRYGMIRNLTFAFPTKNNYFGHPESFKKSMIPEYLLPRNGKVDMFLIHTRLNVTEMWSVLYTDTVWLTILRDPVQQFESLFNYYSLKSIFGTELKNFTEINFSKLKQIHRKKGKKFGYNQMLFDLGAQDDLTSHQFTKYVKYLDTVFDLVLLVERFEESLILMRHKLCWSLKDVLIFVVNNRVPERKEKLSKENKIVIEKLNENDLKLYEYFLKKHERNVKEFGVERLKEEMKELEILKQNYLKYCVESGTQGGSKFLGSYVLNKNVDEICDYLIMPELKFVDELRNKQIKNLNHL